jgi:hypothetical protein
MISNIFRKVAMNTFNHLTRGIIYTAPPKLTKTYNLENELKPFTMNNLWDNKGKRG